MNRNLFFLLVLISISVLSCNKKIDPPLNETEYFPLIVGHYVIYDVDSITFNNFDNSSDTSYYQIMEYVDSSYLGTNGDTLFRIERSRRENDLDPWSITDIWSAKVNQSIAEKVEENLHFIKMDFPILLGKDWLGNIFISNPDSLVPLLSEYDFQNWQYEYTRVHVPISINGLSFDSAVYVSQADDTTAIDTVVFKEYYAKHVGMIYKLEKYIDVDEPDYPDGYFLEMRIREFN